MTARQNVPVIDARLADLSNDEWAERVGWEFRQIEGYHSISARMFTVLQWLAAYDCFVRLPRVNPRTLRSLTQRLWVSHENIAGEDCYLITREGKLALEMYSKPRDARRFDGICPTCGERPRHVFPSGVTGGYCIVCQRKHGRRKVALFGHQRKPDALCPRCKERKLLWSASGRPRSHCVVCDKVLRKESRERRRVRDLALIAAGEFLPCRRCKTKPRAHTERSVSDYCVECRRAYAREYYARKKQQG
jgi:hypothetical protein